MTCPNCHRETCHTLGTDGKPRPSLVCERAAHARDAEQAAAREAVLVGALTTLRSAHARDVGLDEPTMERIDAAVSSPSPAATALLAVVEAARVHRDEALKFLTDESDDQLARVNATEALLFKALATWEAA